MRYSFIQENREKYEYVLHKCESCKKLHYTKLHLNNNTILLPQPSIQLIACKVSMFCSYQLILMHKATKETKRGALLLADNQSSTKIHVSSVCQTWQCSVQKDAVQMAKHRCVQFQKNLKARSHLEAKLALLQTHGRD